MKVYDGIMQGLNEAVEYNRNKELIELAREHATYDIPYSTIQLLNDLADALERVEALQKHIMINLRQFLPDDAELEEIVSREIHLLQRPCNSPTPEEVAARQKKAERELEEAKIKWFGHI